MKVNYKKLNIAIIGIGKVGSAFANELILKGYNVKYLVETNPGFLKKISRKLKIRYYSTSVNKDIISDSQIIIISVQDSRIPGLLKSFRNIDLRNKYIFHTSGYYNSEIFTKLRIEKNKIGSFHPLQTFNDVSLNNQNLLKNIYFGIQGGILLKKLLIYLSKSLRSKYILINEKDKPLYHFACVFASNFLVSYMSILNKIISSTNIKPVKSIEIFYPIIEKTLSNIKENGLINLPLPFFGIMRHPVKIQNNARFIAYYPGIVPGRNYSYITGTEFLFRAVIHFYMHPA